MSKDIYDLTPKEKEIVIWNYKKRLEMRNEFLKKYHNPNTSGSIFDAQIQRLSTITACRDQVAVPTVKNFLMFVGCLFIPLISLTLIHNRLRENVLKPIKTGEVSYRDRHPKFL